MSDVAQVAPGVYTVPHRVVAGKMGLIVGSRRSVAVDCGSDDAEGQALLDLARAGGEGPGLDRLHPRAQRPRRRERPLPQRAGSPPSPTSPPRRCCAGWRRAGRRAAGGAGRGRRRVAVAGGALRRGAPAGPRRAHRPPHPRSRTQPGFGLPLPGADGILFAGDTAVSAIPPAFGDGSGRALEATLRHLADWGRSAGAGSRGRVAGGPRRAGLADLAGGLPLRAAGGGGRRAGRQAGRGPARTAVPEALEGRSWMRRCAWPRPRPCWATACPWTGPSVTGATATTPPGRWPRPSPALVQVAQSPGRAFG